MIHERVGVHGPSGKFSPVGGVGVDGAIGLGDDRHLTAVGPEWGEADRGIEGAAEGLGQAGDQGRVIMHRQS